MRPGLWTRGNGINPVTAGRVCTLPRPSARRFGRNNRSRTAHWASVMSMFSIYAIGHKFQLLSQFKVFMR